MTAGTTKTMRGYHNDKLAARATIEKTAVIITKIIAIKNMIVSIQTCGYSFKTWFSSVARRVRNISSGSLKEVILIWTSSNNINKIKISHYIFS
jgi:hypothetical protein